MVSVRLMTYNHSEFICQAMEGIMAQVTDFKIEVVIGDDFSTDGTLDLIAQYRSTDNVLIRVLDRKAGGHYHNDRQCFGRLFNYVDIVRNCAGKFVAILDGDDYWTDPYKLQKQVDFMEAHPETSLCCHRVQVLRGTNFEPDSFVSGKYDLRYVIAEGRVGHTPSYFFRNYFKSKWGREALQLLIKPGVLSGDRALQLVLGTKGNIVMLEETMAVYRKHGAGIMNARSFRQAHDLGLYLLLKHFDDLTLNSFSDLTHSARRKWLEIVLRRDIVLRNKIRATCYAFEEANVYGLKFLTLLPYYSIKAVLHKLIG